MDWWKFGGVSVDTTKFEGVSVDTTILHTFLSAPARTAFTISTLIAGSRFTGGQ